MSIDVQVEDLLDLWEEACERGERPTPEELCRDAPHLLDVLREKIRALEAVDNHLETKSYSAAGDESQEDRSVTSADSANALCVPVEYSQLSFHAKGGLGIVYRARDQRLHRDVALKFMHRSLTGDPESRTRFLVEAEVTGRLDHPGVIPVHTWGQTEDGRLFYAMRFILGEDLDEAIARYHGSNRSPARPSPAANLEMRQLLARFISVCNTVAYAHNCGIVHRDIKPKNVLLGRFGETLVVDWGLATPVSRDDRARASGERTLVPTSGSQSGNTSGHGAGTPAYMSPEQHSEGALIGPPSDIYSLGVSLYKLLTGQTPFSAPTLFELKQRVLQGDFHRPTQLHPGTPRALEAICLKAMAIKPRDRYPSALEMAADIERFLADERVTAFAEPLSHRLTRWSRRHRTWVRAGIALLCGLILLTSSFAFVQTRLAGREQQARELAEAAQARAEAAREQGLQAAARLAPATVASRIDIRWGILEAVASDSELRKMLQQVNAEPENKTLWKPIQKWITDEFRRHNGNPATDAKSWTLDDVRGMMIARVPASDQIGKNFAYRDYFHGQGRDLDPDQVHDLRPIDHVHRSAVFISKTDQTPTLMFSVPILDDEDRPIGVIGMGVEVGKFNVLHSDLGANQVAVLVDTRPDELGDEPAPGLILQHPQLFERLRAGKSHAEKPLRIDAERLDAFIRLRHARLAEEDLAQAAGGLAEMPREENLERDYTDPSSTDRPEGWIAAFEPVIVRTRRERVIRDTGWIVIVQERQENRAAEPGVTDR